MEAIAAERPTARAGRSTEGAAPMVGYLERGLDGFVKQRTRVRVPVRMKMEDSEIGCWKGETLIFRAVEMVEEEENIGERVSKSIG